MMRERNATKRNHYHCSRIVGPFTVSPWKTLQCLQSIAALLVMAVLCAMPMFAGKTENGSSDPPTGTIQGTLTTTQDGSSAAVAGISVKLLPPSGNTSTLAADTDEAGHYEFTKLKPGTYTISVQLQGFKAITKRVSLGPAQSLIQDFNLELETVAEKVEVHEETQTVSTESVSAPAVTVNQSQLTALPTPQQKVREVLPVTPGVVRTQDGKLNFKGADENQSLLLVNSARTTDPVTGSFAVPIPTDAVESFAVYKTPYDAGLGSFSGGLTTIQTKPPEDQWSFKVRSVVPSFLGKEGHLAGVGEAIPGVAFDVPVIRHKLLFSEVFQYEMKKVTTEGLPWPNDISKRQGFNSFSTLEAILSPNHVLTLTVNAFPLRQQNVDISALIEIPASNDLNQSGVAIGLNDKY